MGPMANVQQTHELSGEDNPALLMEDKAQNLQHAFSVFNDISLQLANSYQHLESQVAQLTDELEVVTQQRFEQLKEKEQLAQRLETLLSVLPGGVIVLDQSGKVVESNPTACEMLNSRLMGRPWREIIKSCFSPRFDDGHEVSTHTGRRLSIATRSLGDEGQIILLTDQTETRELQDKLSRHERLSALGKMVSALAHQVRTPLSSAILYANHLKTQNLSDDIRSEFSTKLLNQLNHLEQQVKDMLLFVKGEVSTNDVLTINELVERLKEATEVIFDRRGLTFKYTISENDGLRKLVCNQDALISAALNLFNNSLQALNSDSEIVLRISVLNKNKVAISVCDNGKGISKKERARACDMFFTTKSQGTGIGLSVVAIVAKAHGGRFSLRSKQGVGTVASIILPLIQD